MLDYRGERQLLAALSQAEEEKSSPDFTIIHENCKDFPCHKNVIMSMCDFFAAMFNADLDDAKSGRVISMVPL